MQTEAYLSSFVCWRESGRFLFVNLFIFSDFSACTGMLRPNWPNVYTRSQSFATQCLKYGEFVTPGVIALCIPRHRPAVLFCSCVRERATDNKLLTSGQHACVHHVGTEQIAEIEKCHLTPRYTWCAYPLSPKTSWIQTLWFWVRHDSLKTFCVSWWAQPLQV